MHWGTWGQLGFSVKPIIIPLTLFLDVTLVWVHIFCDLKLLRFGSNHTISISIVTVN